MVADEIAALAARTDARLKGMTDARPSEILTAREQFGEQVLTLLRQAKGEATPEQKIAAFDRLSDYIIGEYCGMVEGALRGNGYYQDDDFEHYAYETAVECVLGPQAFDALNPLERLLPKRSGRG